VSEKDDLHFYEEEWLKEHGLRHEAEGRAGAAENQLLAAVKEVEKLQRALEKANRLLEEAEEARERAWEEAREARRQANQETAWARETTARLQQELDLLKAHVHRQDFWHKEFALLLAADLDSLDSSINETASPEDWMAVFGLWHQEILEGLGRLAQGQGAEQDGEKVRRLILAQWVYLRWLEVCQRFRESP